jgi:hypothetical protein
MESMILIEIATYCCSAANDAMGQNLPPAVQKMEGVSPCSQTLPEGRGQPSWAHVAFEDHRPRPELRIRARTRRWLGGRAVSPTLDRTHDLLLVEAHMAGIGLPPCRPMVAEDIRDAAGLRWSPPQREHRKCEPNYAPSKVRWIISVDPRPD